MRFNREDFRVLGLTCILVVGSIPFLVSSIRSKVAVAPVNQVVTSIVLPDGDIEVFVPYVIQDQTDIIISGGRNTRIIYKGGPTIGVFQYIKSFRCTLQDITIVVAVPGVDSAVQVTNAPIGTPATGRVSSRNTFSNIWVTHGGYPTAAKRAFSIDSYAAGGVDGNNEDHQFYNCIAQSYREAGFYIRGGQCHNLYFFNCGAHDAGGRKPVGLHAAEGIFFTWHKGSMNSNKIDFLLEAAEIQAVVDGCNSENSRQFLVYNRNGLPFFNGSNIRWDGQPQAGFPVLDCNSPGPWAIKNSYFAGINGVCPLFRFNTPLENGKRAFGSLDLSGTMLRQHGGNQPLGALVITPSTWDIRQHGLRYQRINLDGSRVNKTFQVNVPLAF